MTGPGKYGRTWERPRFAIIPTYYRPIELGQCVRALYPQVDEIIVVNNGETPVFGDVVDLIDVVIEHPEQPPNISRLWNLGIDEATRRARDGGHTTWDVGILNDDAIPPLTWFERVSNAMYAHGCDAAASSSHVSGEVEWHADAPYGVYTRLTGWAFILRGSAYLRADERFQWWCGDDDLSVQARMRGGLVLTPDPIVENTLANSTTVGTLAEQAGRDVQTFVDKWGRRPW